MPFWQLYGYPQRRLRILAYAGASAPFQEGAISAKTGPESVRFTPIGAPVKVLDTIPLL